MPTYSKNEVVLVRFPFSNLAGSKVRPAVVANAPHPSQDVFVVPLTSRVSPLLKGEFALADWNGAGLNVPSAVKRGLYTIHQTLVAKSVGRLSAADAGALEHSLRGWLGLR
ncbi:MAG TPA: type II toxin-antitoxin system PemK/MazF family toxin [Pyrinomonadaceae bacterium]|jgi:mRNA interferase MazF